MKIANTFKIGMTAAALGSATAASADKFVGEIFLTGATFCPAGTLEAKGQLLPTEGNIALFSLFGTTYGGDGNTNFALPNLAAPAAGLRYCVTVTGVFPSRV